MYCQINLFICFAYVEQVIVVHLPDLLQLSPQNSSYLTRLLFITAGRSFGQTSLNSRIQEGDKSMIHCNEFT